MDKFIRNDNHSLKLNFQGVTIHSQNLTELVHYTQQLTNFSLPTSLQSLFETLKVPESNCIFQKKEPQVYPCVQNCPRQLYFVRCIAFTSLTILTGAGWVFSCIGQLQKLRCLPMLLHRNHYKQRKLNFEKKTHIT